MRAENFNSPHTIVRNYILKNISVLSLEDDVDIFDAGIVNSLFAIELMTFLEKSFNIKVTMDDLDMENFKSVNAVSQFIRRKEEGQSV